VIKNVVKHGQTCFFSTRSTLMPSLRARARRACFTTADWVIPRCSESFLSSILSVSLKRMVVVLFIMLDSIAHLLYNASTCKPVCLR
jgi:hypothetical protein